MPPGSLSNSSSSKACRQRLVILVDSEISSSVMPRISRSRCKRSPKEPIAAAIIMGGGWGVSTARSAKSLGNKDFGHGPMVTEVCPAADIFCPLGKPEAIMRPPAFAVTVHLSMTEATASGKRQIQELNIFHDVAKALTSSLNLDSILQTIMDKMAEYFRPDNWSLLMVEEKKQELYFAIAVGEAAETLKNLRLKVGEGIAGWVAKHGESLIVPDVYNDPPLRQAGG